MTEQIVLPDDIQLIPVTELPDSLRAKFGAVDGDYAVTRPFSRVPSKIVDKAAAALLAEFRTPSTIIEAITRFSRDLRLRPTAVLEDAYPLIESCLAAKLLVPPAQARSISASFQQGQAIAGCEILATIQALVDTEVYRVRTPSGKMAALKIGPDRERVILERLDGRVNPTLLDSGVLEDSRHFLVIEWIDGESKSRTTVDEALAIARAYSHLHSQDLIHGDVHPRNVILTPSEAKIVDYGLARFAREDGAPRGGVAFFSEPEFAEAIRVGRRPPATSFLGEQYSVAALLYYLLTGRHYLDFQVDQVTMMCQIAEDSPLPAPELGPLEGVLHKALSKEPAQRFASMEEFVDALAPAPPAVPAAPVGDSLDDFVSATLSQLRDPQRSFEYTGPGSPSASITYGAAGIAYALSRIAAVRGEGSLLALADLWADRAAGDRSENAFYHPDVQITPETVGRISPYHTPSGAACVEAVLAARRGDLNGLQAGIERYLQACVGPCENLDLTLGKSSVLVGLVELLGALRLVTPDIPTTLIDWGSQRLDAIWKELQTHPPIAGKGPVTHLGLAHGWAGLIYTALLWSQTTGTTVSPAVEVRLLELAELAERTPHGLAWPWQLGRKGQFVPGWCNGHAGHVFLWALAHRVYGEAAYLRLAEGVAMEAFHSTVAAPTLCCGAAGQAYSQLAMFRLTGDNEWLDRARQLTRNAVSQCHSIRRNREQALPFSFYKGDVGVAVVAAEINEPRYASMPLFESL